MSSFELAIPFVLNNEGGFVDDPDDQGGITNFGISLRFLQSLGTKYDFNQDGIVDATEIRELTEDNAKIIYRNEFWNKYQYSQIYNQLLANKVFDMAVNMGATQAHILTQRSVWAMAQNQTLQDDGILGADTLAELNKWNATLLPPIRAEQAGFYHLLAQKNPTQSKFLTGWLKRCYKL